MGSELKKVTVAGNINPFAVLQDEKKLCYLDPMMLIKLGYLKIKDKNQKLVNFTINEVQKQVIDKIRMRRVQSRPVRLCILKGRQFGVSTLSEAIIYSFASQRPNINALIMADIEDGANYLFQMCKVFHAEIKRDEPHLAPELKVDTENQIEFAKSYSQILTDTAKNPNAGRKYTFHLAHLSEAAFFKDFATTMSSLMQSMPERPETICIVETTANGENDFCVFWRHIEMEFEKNPQECDWIPIFLSWKDHSEYTRQFKTIAEKNYFLQTMSKKEKEVMKDHNLTLEQMNWRRHTIVNKCGGKTEKFNQEYPLSADEAFVTTGKRVYKEEVTKPQEKNLMEPKHKGSIEFVNGRPTFVDDETGDLLIYKMPAKGHRYVMAIDASDGVAGGDFACAQILDRSTWEQVAILHGTIPPDVLGDRCNLLGRFYGFALAAPEINSHGLVTTLKLRDLNYPNIVRHTKINVSDQGDYEESESLGWVTNSKTKPIILGDLAESLRDILIVIHDKSTLAEIKHYAVLKRNDSGNVVYGGSGGYNDDRVMSLAIAVHFAKTLPDSSSSQSSYPEQNEVRSNRKTGY